MSNLNNENPNNQNPEYHLSAIEEGLTDQIGGMISKLALIQTNADFLKTGNAGMAS